MTSMYRQRNEEKKISRSTLLKKAN